MSDQARHIVVATDERFVVPTATTLRSLSHKDPSEFTVWVLASGVSEDSKLKMARSVGGSLDLRWIDMRAAQLGDTSKSSIGRATYYRLAISDVLPSNVDRVLYMDTDMLVTDSLSPLWDLDLGAKVIWAVRSVHYPSICTYGAMDHWPELGLDPRAPYFNAGLMMIDLEQWRALDIGRRALEHLGSPLANGALADQEALNVLLHGRWGELEPRWNQQTPLLEHNRGSELMYSDEVLRQARQEPAVIHFLNRPKPWHRDCRHPATQAWRTEANATEFAPLTLETTPLIGQAKWRLRRAASAIVRGR